MGRPKQLISRAIELLHKAGSLLDQVGADQAVSDINRAVVSARFARAAPLQAEKVAASVSKPNRSLDNPGIGTGSAHVGRHSQVGG
jgi:hypothetical protein